MMRVLELRVCEAADLRDIPLLPFEGFADFALKQIGAGARVVSYWAKPETNGGYILYLAAAYDNEGRLEVVSTAVGDRFASLTPKIPQAHLFEREIFERWNIMPIGHPWLKPVRFTAGSGHAKNIVLPGDMSYFKVGGGEVHETAVGPVHAGIIEPGHFRFICHGENVLHLEISLGYQHRGIERAITETAQNRIIHYMETLAGDTTIGHTLAYCGAVEGLSNCEVPMRALVIRGIMLELERLANHTGDLGALSADAGFLPTASYCGRLRGDFLNLTALICGNRFGRNMLKPGGVCFDLNDDIIIELQKKIGVIYKDVKNAVSLLWSSSSVSDRFEETGILSKDIAYDLGVVGVAARACGIERDIRFDFPAGIFRFCQIPVATCDSGDVFSRAFVRWLEIQRSVEFISEQLGNMPKTAVCAPIMPMGREKIIFSLVEGWRGEICHAVATDEKGGIAQYKIKDPSFNNWMGLAMAMRGEEVSDFPLCNKSFNLSYCGHDL